MLRANMGLKCTLFKFPLRDGKSCSRDVPFSH